MHVISTNFPNLFRQANNCSFNDFHSASIRILEKHGRLKKTYIRAIQKDFMDKELNQAFMVRSKFRNKFLKLKTEKNRIVYVSQHISCVNMLRRRN